ncbi:hypothetical protein GGI43DRAFT_413520 [Trichoderma evansii]
MDGSGELQARDRRHHPLIQLSTDAAIIALISSITGSPCYRLSRRSRVIKIKFFHLVFAFLLLSFFAAMTPSVSRGSGSGLTSKRACFSLTCTKREARRNKRGL